jgi:DNA-directed RNA polymerase subunit N (RpoN/RPB10)
MRCCTCGNMLSDKWRAYQYLVDVVTQQEVLRMESNECEPAVPEKKGKTSCAEKSVEGNVLDALDLTQMCCRLHMLTNVDLLDKL